MTLGNTILVIVSLSKPAGNQHAVLCCHPSIDGRWRFLHIQRKSYGDGGRHGVNAEDNIMNGIYDRGDPDFSGAAALYALKIELIPRRCHKSQYILP